jgi:hypothetical protein
MTVERVLRRNDEHEYCQPLLRAAFERLLVRVPYPHRELWESHSLYQTIGTKAPAYVQCFSQTFNRLLENRF